MADSERFARVGRPRLPGKAKYIRLRESVFNLWRERKESYGKLTDSEFAESLLHRRGVREPVPGSDVHVADTLQVSSQDPGLIPLCSTPARGMPDRQPLLESVSFSNSDVDVTGMTSIHTCLPVPGIAKVQSVRLLTSNSSFNAVEGNPFSIFEHEDSDQSDDDVMSVGSSDTDDNFGLFSEDHYFTSRMSSVIEQLGNSDTDESDDSDDSDDDEFSELNVTGNAILNKDDELTKLLSEEMDISSEEDDERTLTMVQDVADLSQMSQQSLPGPVREETILAGDSPHDLVATPQSLEGVQPVSSQDVEQSKKVKDNKGDILLALENSLEQLTRIGDELKDFAQLHQRSRYIVSAQKLLELAGSKCTLENDGHPCCGSVSHDTKTVGGNIEVISTCTNGHSKKWLSSEVLAQKNNQNIFVNDSVLPAAILISGNNYQKFSLMCKALGLNVLSRNTFMRFQKHCAAPVIEEVWNEMNDLVRQLFKDYEDVCLCGDGRNDSPGHSARYCVYTLMEHFTNVVVDFEVIDKRETGGNSTAMEKEALRRLLERMAAIFPFDELTTDASPSIIKLVRDLKEKFPQLMELFHSLDIWHKAKKLNKALHQAAKIKGCGDLQEWIDCIVNHFWFCSQDCSGNVDELKETWAGVLHHVCGEHTWATGQCKHDPLDNEASDKRYLEKNSKAMAALRKIVLDPKWLRTLHFYVKFRHTSVLESYNSMMTKYVPKRMAFEYPYFIMRVMLAAIDQNMHLHRKSKLTSGGKEQGHRKFSKRSQKFHAEIVKEEKSYSYFPFLVAKMLHRRSMYEGSFTLPSDRNSFDPKQIATTIGMKEPPRTEELMKGPSRFDKKCI